MTVHERPVETGDKIRIPGGKCIATVDTIRVTPWNPPDAQDVILKGDPEQWNADLVAFRELHGRPCLGTEVEYAE